MNISKKMTLGIVSLSSALLIAACDNNSSEEVTPVETDNTGETTVEINEESTENTEDETSQETDNGSDETDTDDTTNEDTTNEDTDTATEGTGNGEGSGIENVEFEVSVFDAIDIVNSEFNNPNFEKIEFEREDGRYVYDIEAWDSEFEYEMEIDAETGQIISQEIDEDDDEEDILDLDDIITPQEAMEIALNERGAGYVKEWELELENGYTVYDIDIEGARDIDIDAHTGEVR